MSTVESVWAVGRYTVQPLVELLAPLRNYGSERVPLEGGVVLAFNHFSWVDPPAFGAASPRTIHYLAKSEIHRHFGLGELIRAFGARSVRRGESDREAVRAMREIVRDGDALGLFVEGTRQKNGLPGEARRRHGRAPGRRPRRAGCDLREPVLEARQLRAGLDRLGRADAVRGHSALGKGLPRGLDADPGRDPPALALARGPARERPP